jgi:hypothetical protein
MSDLDKLREKAQAATPELWRAYYDDYGEPASEDDLGYRPGTMLVAPDPFDGDRILIDGLTPQEAMRIVGALNVREAALIERERALTEALRAAIEEADQNLTRWLIFWSHIKGKKDGQFTISHVALEAARAALNEVTHHDTDF